MLKSNLKILVIVKKKDIYSKNFLKFIKKNFSNVLILYSEDRFKKLFISKISNWNGNYIFSFRSKFILNNKIIKKANKYAINFHPGPPEYRGIGCINYAIINREKKYGVTAHIINNAIDSGRILKVKYFSIDQKNNLKKILDQTHRYLYSLSIQIVKDILRKKKFTKIKRKWSKKLYTLKDLENLYNLNNSLKKYNIDEVLRATLLGNFKPYLIYKKKKFYIH